MLNIGLVTGSTWPNRFVDRPIRWLGEGASARHGLELCVLELRDPSADALRSRVEQLDAFIAIVPDYNHAPTVVLQTAFDSAPLAWQRKPIAFVAYGGVGASRAIQTLRRVAVDLDMTPIRPEVNIPMESFLGVLQSGRSLNEYEYLSRCREAMLDQLAWWGEVLKAARNRMTRETASAA